VASTPNFETFHGEEPIDDLKAVVSYARDLVDREIARADRIDGKSRAQVQLAGQWFAIVQAVLAVALNLNKDDFGLLVWLAAGCALLGGLALAASVFFSWGVWRLNSRVESTAPEALPMLVENAGNREHGTMHMLVSQLEYELRVRRRVNAGRVANQRKAEVAWLIAMGIPLLELCFALSSALFT